jgi:hypothetical protein
MEIIYDFDDVSSVRRVNHSGALVVLLCLHAAVVLGSLTALVRSATAAK